MSRQGCWGRRQYALSKCWEPLTRWYIVTSQKNRVFNHNAVITLWLPKRTMVVGSEVGLYLFVCCSIAINLIKKSCLLSHSSQVKWHEVCLHVPAAIKEVLVAWEHGAVTANDVKRILDAMRSRMCCLPVCAAAWLCSYMQVCVFLYRCDLWECTCF